MSEQKRYTFDEPTSTPDLNSGDLIKKSIVLVDNKTQEAHRFTLQMYDPASSSPSITVENQKEYTSGHFAANSVLQGNQAKEQFNLLKDVAKASQAGREAYSNDATDMVKRIKRVAPQIKPKTPALEILGTKETQNTTNEQKFEGYGISKSNTTENTTVVAKNPKTDQVIIFSGEKTTISNISPSEDENNTTQNVKVYANLPGYNAVLTSSGVEEALELARLTQEKLWANPNEALNKIVDIAIQTGQIKTKQRTN